MNYFDELENLEQMEEKNELDKKGLNQMRDLRRKMKKYENQISNADDVSNRLIWQLFVQFNRCESTIEQNYIKAKFLKDLQVFTMMSSDYI